MKKVFADLRPRAALPALRQTIHEWRPDLVVREFAEFAAAIVAEEAGVPHARVSDENADIQAGINIVLRALEAPIRQIAENAGVEGSIVVGKITENKSQTFGFDAQTEQYVDMLSAGIVDPAKVVRVALQDATSIAGLMITTEAMVAEAPKKKEAPAMPGGGMGGTDY